MPLVQITLARGRTPEQLATLGEAVTAAVHSSIGAPRENVRVVLRECEPSTGSSAVSRSRRCGRPGRDEVRC